MSSNQNCVACGGQLVFDPKKQMLKCANCGALVAIEGTVTSEKSFIDLLRSAPQWQGDTVVYRCEHCGAKSIINNTDLAKHCDYCGASNIIRIEDLPGLRPDTVALFKITKDEAVTKARQWLSKRFFAPKWYKKTATAQNVSAIYYPAFTFDAQTISNYHGYKIVTHTNTIYVNGEAQTSTYKTREPIVGRLPKIFDDILIPATNNIPESVLQELQPFETNEAKAYKKEYLSGYTATRYTKDAKQCWEEAKCNMQNQVKSEICRAHDVNIEDLHIEMCMTNITYKYVLLPLYIGHTEYEGEKYEIFINGQTGKTYGKTPLSVWKALGVTALGLLALTGAFLLAFLL